MLMDNPFTLTFGVVPEQFIARDDIVNQVFSEFFRAKNGSNVFILKGVRGSGKTVMLNYLRKQFEQLEEWITVNVNPEMDILEGIASKLYEKGSLKKYFLKPAFDFSFHGFGFSIEGENPVKNIETLLEKMMAILEKHGKRVLVTIDEIANGQNMKIFAHTFKNMVSDGHPIYLLATGINENVSNLENNQTLTFIYRAPKIDVGSLNLYAIARSYKETLGLSEEVANKCAALTEGYASAYQILGSILFRMGKKDIDDDVLFEFDKILEEINYGKLWDDLTKKEKEFLFGFASSKENKAKDIIERSTISKNSYSTYRDRLLKLGIVTSDSYGYLSFALPRLFQFVQRKKAFASFDF